MNDRNPKLPGVHNLTTEKKNFVRDEELVEKELDRLINKEQVLPDDHEAVTFAPRDRPEDEETLRDALKDLMIGRLEELKLVLLMDEWPEVVKWPSDPEGATYVRWIAEKLGIYIEDIRRLWPNLRSELRQHVDASVLEQIDKVCNEPKGAVPTVILLMKPIKAEGEQDRWKKRFAVGDHGWLTSLVLRHEIGHHVFPVDAKDYVAGGANCAATIRAEAGANWYAWLVGSAQQRVELNAFADNETEPRWVKIYQAYRKMIDWMRSEPIAPGAFATSKALAQEFVQVISIIFLGHSGRPIIYDDSLIEKLRTELPWDLSIDDEAWQEVQNAMNSAKARAKIYECMPEMDLFKPQHR